MNNFTINNKSVYAVCGELIEEAQIYGFKHCKYLEVQDALRKSILVHDWNFNFVYNQTTIKDSYRSYMNMYKCGLVNMVIENYARQKKGLTIIPIIFCINYINSCGENIFPLTLENLLSKVKKTESGKLMKDIITHKELLRCYKLCNDKDVNKTIRDVANKSLKFVEVIENDSEKTSSIELIIKKISAPWERQNWYDLHFFYRKNKIKHLDVNNWRDRLNKIVESDLG